MVWSHMGWDLWEWLYMLLFLLVFLGFVLWGVLASFEGLGRTERNRDHLDSSAGEILARRFARGEITTREYRHRLEVLGLQSPAQDAPPRSDAQEQEAQTSLPR